ncbi:hypothetical protein ACLCDV_08090 [Sphingobacterium sp. Lzh-3]|uniref:hypothetical protein n=1 Tax=Sphingobacterium sp. Lzh-3 TaxID=3382150 RepID=UPI00398C8D81
MDNKKTKPLKVTEIQQKAFDVYSYYWKEIWSTVVFLVGLGAWVTSFISSASGDELNKIRSEYDVKMDSVISREKRTCQETMNNLTKFMVSINPNVKSTIDSSTNRKKNEN